uniref:Deltamethrin resistance protein prag01 domain-containing protein n=1 Tax=Trichogramma kaykai TaxID=54128 RepID=A0ABD2VX27_9HYME
MNRRFFHANAPLIRNHVSSSRNRLPRLLIRRSRQSIMYDFLSYGHNRPDSYTNNGVRPDALSRLLYYRNRALAGLLAFGVIMLTAIFVYMLICTGLVSRHSSRLSNHWVRIA